MDRGIYDLDAAQATTSLFADPASDPFYSDRLCVSHLSQRSAYAVHNYLKLREDLPCQDAIELLYLSLLQ
jgi:hypothetical protein